MRAGFPLVLLTACMGPYPGPGSTTGGAVCDGALQASEGDVVDGPFDRDGDGFVDGTDAGCAAAYASDRLDCDDGAADVHPDGAEVRCNDRDDDCDAATADGADDDGDGSLDCVDCDDDDGQRYPGAVEACGDRIDNDCDGRVDFGCPEPYDGTWVLDQTVAYSCGFGSVEISFDRFEVDEDPPFAIARFATGVQPGEMTGTIEDDGSFVFEASNVLGTAFSCSEYYRITGTFSPEGTLDAVFACDFDGVCGNCAYQAFAGLTGTLQ